MEERKRGNEINSGFEDVRRRGTATRRQVDRICGMGRRERPVSAGRVDQMRLCNLGGRVRRSMACVSKRTELESSVRGGAQRGRPDAGTLGVALGGDSVFEAQLLAVLHRQLSRTWARRRSGGGRRSKPNIAHGPTRLASINPSFSCVGAVFIVVLFRIDAFLESPRKAAACGFSLEPKAKLNAAFSKWPRPRKPMTKDSGLRAVAVWCPCCGCSYWGDVPRA
jgi:hypothetical protein